MNIINLVLFILFILFFYFLCNYILKEYFTYINQKKCTVVTINNIKYKITNKDDIIQNTLLNKKQWNEKIFNEIKKFINQYQLQHFVNIGCHIGTVALPISRYINKVTAIEAFKPTFEHLQTHIKMNKIKNINAFNVALGDKTEDIFFLDVKNERIKNNSGGMHVITLNDIKTNSRSANIHSKKISGKMIRLDNLKIEPFDIMLIDVEGFEETVLKGGRAKILKHKPIIIIELWDDKKRIEENMTTSQNYMINYIINMGYKLIRKIENDFIFIPQRYNTIATSS